MNNNESSTAADFVLGSGVYSFVTSLPSLSLAQEKWETHLPNKFLKKNNKQTKKNTKKYSLQVYIVIDISLLLQDKLQQTMEETAQSVTESL